MRRIRDDGLFVESVAGGPDRRHLWPNGTVWLMTVDGKVALFLDGVLQATFASIEMARRALPDVGEVTG